MITFLSPFSSHNKGSFNRGQLSSRSSLSIQRNSCSGSNKSRIFLNTWWSTVQQFMSAWLFPLWKRKTNDDSLYVLPECKARGAPIPSSPVFSRETLFVLVKEGVIEKGNLHLVCQEERMPFWLFFYDSNMMGDYGLAQKVQISEEMSFSICWKTESWIPSEIWESCQSTRMDYRFLRRKSIN